MPVLLILALLGSQEVDRIPKTQKEYYYRPVEDCEKAAGLLGSDSKQALDLLNDILSNSKINNRDRRLRIETSGGDFTRKEPYDFYPHQYRGRARMALARGDSTKAKDLLDGAIEDLQRSLDDGVKSSEEHLKAAREARKKLDEAKTPETDPEPAFRKEWDNLIRENKFASAQRHLETRGTFLDETKRKSYLTDTSSACDRFVGDRLSRCRNKMSATHTTPALKALKQFDEEFALPDDKELVRSYPELEWARQERRALEQIRDWNPKPQGSHEEMKATLGLLADQLVAAQKFEDQWFDLADEILYSFLRERLQAVVKKAESEEGTPDERRRLKKRVEEIQAQLTKSKDRIPMEIVERHPNLTAHQETLEKLAEQFPVDLTELESIDLDACYSEPDPISALRGVETKLRGMRTQHRHHLSKDSSRKLMTFLVAAAAMRQLLEGKELKVIVDDLKDWRDELNGLGGPTDAKRWGPKVESVFSGGK